MADARTLLQLAGASLAPARLTDSVVVIVDAQREYVDGALPLAGVGDALHVIEGLLHRARVLDAPVIHVVHRGRAGGLFDPAGPFFDIADQAAPARGEQVVEKGLPNAFADTDLGGLLKATGRRELVLAGFMTHMCISSTARAALDHGLRTTIAADACATRDLPDPLGSGVIPAADLHRAALTELADRFAIVCRAADIH